MPDGESELGTNSLPAGEKESLSSATVNLYLNLMLINSQPNVISEVNVTTFQLVSMQEQVSYQYALEAINICLLSNGLEMKINTRC